MFTINYNLGKRGRQLFLKGNSKVNAVFEQYKQVRELFSFVVDPMENPTDYCFNGWFSTDHEMSRKLLRWKEGWILLGEAKFWGPNGIGWRNAAVISGINKSANYFFIENLKFPQLISPNGRKKVAVLVFPLFWGAPSNETTFDKFSDNWVMESGIVEEYGTNVVFLLFDGRMSKLFFVGVNYLARYRGPNLRKFLYNI